MWWIGTLPSSTGFASRHGDLYMTKSHELSNPLAGEVCDLWKTSDLGNSWSLLSIKIAACAITVDPSHTQRMYGLPVGYAVSFSPTIFRSVDGGATWQRIGMALLSPIKRLRVGADGTVYAVGDTVYVSRDRGDTWIRTSDLTQKAGQSEGGVPAIADLLPVRHPTHGDNYVVAATWNGIFTSTDSGITWEAAGLQDFVTFRLDAIEPPPGAVADMPDIRLLTAVPP